MIHEVSTSRTELPKHTMCTINKTSTVQNKQSTLYHLYSLPCGSQCRADELQTSIQFTSDQQGTLIIHSGLYCLTKPIELLSNIQIILESNVIIQSKVSHCNDWPTEVPFPSYGQGRDYKGPRRKAVFWARNRSNVSIHGATQTNENGEIHVSSSIIDGGGEIWWQQRLSREENDITRGPLLEFESCQYFSISNITLQNSPFWTIHPIYCHDMEFNQLIIKSPLDGSAPNTDGINPDSSYNITISQCNIQTGDDCIAIKSGWDHYGRTINQPCHHITIMNCYLSSPRCAAITFGSEMSGGIYSIEMKDCKIIRSKQAIHVKTAEGRGGSIKYIYLSNCQVELTDIIVRLNAFYRGHPFDYTSDPLVPTPVIRHLYFNNLQLITCPTALIEARALPNMKYRQVHFNHLQAIQNSLCMHSDGITKSSLQTVDCPLRSIEPFLSIEEIETEIAKIIQEVPKELVQPLLNLLTNMQKKGIKWANIGFRALTIKRSETTEIIQEELQKWDIIKHKPPSAVIPLPFVGISYADMARDLIDIDNEDHIELYYDDQLVVGSS